jgi:NAD(P)-dependent dehydrogenase (short-subunit alcohol dehydrogenase family)
MLLKGKHIVITGAAGALGESATRIATSHGATVSELDINFTQTTKNRHSVDLKDGESVKKCIESLNSIDALFNIAGGFLMGSSVIDTSDADWDTMRTINFTTMLNVTRAVLPGMLHRKAGAIVNVGAYSALSGQSQMGAYVSAKASVMRMTESLALEVRDLDVNINAVLPSIIDTPVNRADMPDADFSKWVRPDDLSETMCFLASDNARAINGALIPVVAKS